MNDFLNSLFPNFEPFNFVDNLEYMGVGMACIFIVIGAIALSVVALNAITSAVEKRMNNEE